MMYRAVAVADAVGGAGGDGCGDVVLCVAGGLIEALAVGEEGCKGRGEGAACAVGVGRVKTERTQAENLVGLGIVEDVHKFLVMEMPCLQHN